MVTFKIIFDGLDFLLRIEWYGPETKPVNRAAFATKNRKIELEKWQSENSGVRHIAIISETEVIAIEKLLSRNPFSINQGLYKPEQFKQQYVIMINSGGKDYNLELGFSREILEKLELIKGCLEPVSRDPIDAIIDQVRLWKS